MPAVLASRCRMIVTRDDPAREAPESWTFASNRLALHDIGFDTPVTIRGHALGPTLRLGAAIVERAALGTEAAITVKQVLRRWTERPPTSPRGEAPWAMIYGGRATLGEIGADTRIGRDLEDGDAALIRATLDRLEWVANGRPITETILFEAGRRLRDGDIRVEVAEEAQTALSAKPKGDNLRLGILDRRPGGAGQWLAAFRDVETATGLQATLRVAASVFEAAAEAFHLADLSRVPEDSRGAEAEAAMEAGKRRLVRLQNEIEECLDSHPVHFAPTAPDVTTVLRNAGLA